MSEFKPGTQRALKDAGWAVGQTVAARKRYGFVEKVYPDGRWTLKCPDGSEQDGREADPIMAAMECANRTFKGRPIDLD
jgi:hypothetical protein